MKLLSKQVLRGPNIWSNYRKKLIQVRLDLEEMEDFPTDKIPGFRERIEVLLPGLIEHECSEMVRGGFLTRIERGTWMGHVIEHIALEIQTMAGMETGYGRTRGTGIPGVYNMVFAYQVEEAGLYAADAAFRIAESLIKSEYYDIDSDIVELVRLKNRYSLGPSTKSIVDEAVRRGIPWTRTDNSSTIQLGYGANQMSFRATIGCNTSALAVDTAGDKDLTKKLLAKAMIPVPSGGVCANDADLKSVIERTGYPIVIKPLKGNQGRGATIKITSWSSAREALALALEYGRYALVEKYVSGFDFRMLVIDHKFVAAAKRIPAHVIGDGISNIQELIDIVNSDPKRGEGHQNVLTQIKIDQDTMNLLEQSGLTLDSIPENGDVIFLKSTANLSTGGTAIDITDEVHPENIFMAERLSRVINLDICGIDLMAPSLGEAIKDNGGVVLEVNAAPGFRMHLQPSEGQPRNVAAAVVDMLYPPGKPSRIPIIAITGTNGKTTTTRVMAQLAKNNGCKVGYTTTDGIYIGDYLLKTGDTTGPVSAATVLADPTIDIAVLETARGGLLRSGLSFDQCDIAILTNVKEDHLGLKDINTLEDLANVKAVVVRSVKKDGWAILNADDEQCVRIGKELDCNVAYFSLDQENEVIKNHREANRPVAVFENGFISIADADGLHRIAHVETIPLTHGGKCKFMIANALSVALAGFLHGFCTGRIIETLQTFEPGFEQTPGRLNTFRFEKFEVLVDYAHNPHGYLAIEDFVKNIDAKRKIGIITGIGDRRDEDIKECAAISQRMFDHVIIRFDNDLRGSSSERITKLLLDGLNTTDKKVTYEIIEDELAAVQHVLQMASEGDYIVILSEAYKNVVEIIRSEQDHQTPLISISEAHKGPDSSVA
ncbi:MAG: cyanophycin synthetase [Flavobacterium sp.]|nr:cyanophycin synthetase [Flavobacterium sp.]